MKISQTETLQRLSIALKNLTSARKRLDEKGSIKSIEVFFDGDSYEKKDRVFISVENIFDFGGIKIQLAASLDNRIDTIKNEMIALLQ